MFSEKKSTKMAENSNSQQNTIAKGTQITGDIVSEGDFRIEGKIEGNIQTPGKVVIGKTGVVNGTLKAANADIEGYFSGKLFLTDTLSLKATAHVEGEVEVGKIAVEPGANFNATCQMKGALKESNSATNNNQKGKEKTVEKGQVV
ncbi:polymer-forming cytoskeletal protein [Subsaximicrobium wynnwilliamsii]|jgi:cytoskeletal protein CcmA (bactofilin family)|uniref:Polymer-forming cytoskeletal protein n=1 Tax=Subsaximicrobium wynnwilliamsii TaxID=291179 RepID=A0A5C6ZHM0_9FLAO|nr:polymer-forming cytoskeletal protein [Subsaximicrobium wynnwilliamsii]TXD83932.1 polymer-forming cytoskeletal protein [Subsaximicrobium wynnwilliamsii]TXD89672.1 polymer-forming cytoskeletal protein [Subsaximicrobium wynnwilliamsii]TXE01657.1 polymer-forming cytoskeletal protein [Subsaximicrobium wynnwilliamsii]